MISVVTTQPCHCSVNAAIDNMLTHKQGCLFLKITLYIQKKKKSPDLAQGA